ncbi:MAG TPA: hypothetical protein VIM16_18715 [Mucilaginibacter sp.]|jgi:hypothetical protein
MYWYRSRLKIASALLSGIALVVCSAACKPDAKETGTSLKYFDINGYFAKDIARLKKLNKPVNKTVTHNGVSESKTVHIDDWGREFDLFVGSDINRPAWKNSYIVITEDSLLIYKAKYPELKVREMLIKKDKEKVKWILIYSKTPQSTWLGLKVPSLYQTREKLSYFPDSLYLIEKDQRVRLMGINHYVIKGVIGR